MPRIIAIDYGTKRTGLAVTDPNKIIATALDTVHSAKVIEYLKDYLKREAVEGLVVGEPKQMNNTPSEITPQLNVFLRQLKDAFPDLPIYRVDERFTSKMAMQSMLIDGSTKADRRNKELIDQRSAVIILQTYLDSQSKTL